MHVTADTIRTRTALEIVRFARGAYVTSWSARGNGAGKVPYVRKEYGCTKIAVIKFETDRKPEPGSADDGNE